MEKLASQLYQVRNIHDNLMQIACVCLSIRSRVATSHVQQVSICAKNWAWRDLKLAALALACMLVNRQWSQTRHILKPSGKTIAWEEYRNSIQLHVVVWWTWSILTCSTLIGVFLAFESLQLPSSIAQKWSATLTPVMFQISQLSASWSYSSTEKSSHPMHSVSSAICKSVLHIPCSVDFNHHLIVSMMLSQSKLVPSRTCTWYAPPVVHKNNLWTHFFSKGSTMGMSIGFSLRIPSLSWTAADHG